IVFPIAMIFVALMLVLAEAPDVATAGTMASGGLTIIMLHIWERYRQRFYLNKKMEQGIHWRAKLLQFAKWPYQLAGVIDVLVDRQFPYVMTPKTAVPSRLSLVLWPHLSILGLMGFAWGIGLAIHGTIPVTVQVCAGAVVVLTLGLLVTEWRGSGETNR
ncbi:MAG: hypothetical protein KJS98_11185, partial [Nitrospirae bacterium]|nr:hypothetical protein [Nitrospirota bacterium]